MRKTIAAFAVLGLLSIAPAALAAEPTATEPSAAQATFVTPQAQSVDKAELSARHTVADSVEQSQAAGRRDRSTGLLIGGLLGIAIAFALLSGL